MGLDLVELVMTAEEKFKVSISALPDGRRKRGDWTAGEFFEAVLVAPRHCTACDYDLRTQSPGGRCPECGGLIEEITWDSVRAIISEQARVPSDKINPETLLAKDLNLSF